MTRVPADFVRLGKLLQEAAARRARRRRRVGVALAVALTFAAISGASIAASQSVRTFFGIGDEYTILEEGTVSGVPFAKVEEKKTGQQGAFVQEPEIQTGGDRYQQYLRWQQLSDEVLRAASQEIFGEVCTVEELTQAEITTIETYVAEGFRPGDAKAAVDTHLAVDEAIAPGGEAPCRGIGFAHSQVDLVFRGVAPPSDLFPGARATYEAAVR
jgi:hypothetical protein